MMGIINENSTVNKLIDEMGVYETIRYVGGYNNFVNLAGEDYILKLNDIIGMIKKIIADKFNGSYIADKAGDEIIISDSDEGRIVIFSVNFNGCWGIHYAKTENGTFQELSEFEEIFESLPKNTLITIFDFLSNK